MLMCLYIYVLLLVSLLCYIWSIMHKQININICKYIEKGSDKIERDRERDHKNNIILIKTFEYNTHIHE